MLTVNSDMTKTEILDAILEFSDEIPALAEASPSWKKAKLIQFVNATLEDVAAAASKVDEDTVFQAVVSAEETLPAPPEVPAEVEEPVGIVQKKAYMRRQGPASASGRVSR